MNTRTFRALLALAGLLPLAPTAFAAESFDNCTGFITTLPATISTQGTWCLRQDLSTNMTFGKAITVNTSNVTIDCNGYKIGGLAGGDGTTAKGIYAANRANTAIRNCTIRGFYAGADVNGSAALVEDNRFEGNTLIGVEVSGSGSTIRRNTVVSTGGSTVLPGLGAYGLRAQDDVDVIDNTIDTVFGEGVTEGLHLENSIGASIVGNRVRNILASGATAYGIQAVGVTRVTVADNQVVGTGNGIGIECSGIDSPALGNTVAGFDTTLMGCDNIAGTNLLAN